MNPNDENSPKFSSPMDPFDSPSSVEFEAGTGSVPVPMGCLQGTPVPPFLSKTFDLVDEPSLDPIISWASNGVSFVVWDPLEFSRLVLPRHFKHNNFSSFVRQLNTYGFRKIDSDKWEFFNDAFQRGKKHLLKNIQRRRSSHSQQVGSCVGSSSDAGKFGVEVEIEKLRKERTVLMQEVVDLQQQQRATVQHAGEVNQRLQSAEQRQKQMVSFLAKLFQNPSFLARLKQKKKEQIGIESPRVRRKFLKQHQNETGTSETLKEDQIVRYQPDWSNIPMSAETPVLSPVSIEHSPHYLSQDLAREMSVENIASDELAALPGIVPTPEIFGDGPSSFGLEDPLLKGKNVMSPNQEVLPEYFLSFAEVSTEENGFPEFSPLETESMIKQEDLWEPEFNIDVAASSSGNELWGNSMNYGVPEFGVTSGLSESDLWNIDFGSLGIDQWPGDESPLDERADQPKED